MSNFNTLQSLTMALTLALPLLANGAPAASTVAKAAAWQNVQYQDQAMMVSLAIPARCAGLTQGQSEPARPLYQPGEYARENAELQAQQASKAGEARKTDSLPNEYVLKPDWENMPAHIYFDLGRCVPGLEVRVLPVQAYAAIYHPNAKVDPAQLQRFTDLQQHIRTAGVALQWSYIPFLDASASAIVGARYMAGPSAQVARRAVTQTSKITNNSASNQGVRVITAFGADAQVFLGQSATRYIYQGFRVDGKYFVLIEAPIHHDQLAADTASTHWGSSYSDVLDNRALQAWQHQYQQAADRWFASVEPGMQPMLQELDRIATSVQVEPKQK